MDPSLCDQESMPASDGDCNTEECTEASGEGSGEGQENQAEEPIKSGELLLSR